MLLLFDNYGSIVNQLVTFLFQIETCRSGDWTTHVIHIHINVNINSSQYQYPENEINHHQPARTILRNNTNEPLQKEWGKY